ncbi:hypothetical protein Psch_03203 [Pelotomaculum schinkii]|uniref:Uncharacterized protein n=1 Tax=Pelotomaculum schinkii TaxID=78350 RepID=A0A4Y7RBL9_9FIRM|nr:hypothetical protein [Pelotomaculum schinkii]TEB06159.1 hypothetical protein Psch_03203 [Pelotomaculum schinkii]
MPFRGMIAKGINIIRLEMKNLKKFLLATIMTFILVLPAMAEESMSPNEQQEISMVSIRAYAESYGDVVYFEMTGGYIPQVFVFTDPPTGGKDYFDVYQFVDGSAKAYKNGVPFIMPAAAYIDTDDRMYIPESVAEEMR